MKNPRELTIYGYCKKLMLSEVLQIISFLLTLYTVTFIVILCIYYRNYTLMIFCASIAIIVNSVMLLCASSIKRSLSTTPFALKIRQSQSNEILQALEVKPVIPGAYYNFQKIGRTSIRLLVLLRDETEVKVVKKRANAVINKWTKCREAQPLFEIFKMLRLNLTIEESLDRWGGAVSRDVLYCSHGRAEMILSMAIFLQDHQLLIPPLPKDAEPHEIRRYRDAVRMLENALPIEYF